MRRLQHLCCVLFLLSPLVAHAELCDEAPTIGISGEGPKSEYVIPIVTSLQLLGATVSYLSHSDGRSPATDIPALDAIVIGHNRHDINPIRYDQEKKDQTHIETDLLRAQYEYVIIDLALKAQMPLLAINGGMLRLNVSGPPDERGSLFQHVKWQDQLKSKPAIPLYRATESVDLKAESLLAELSPLSEEPLKVNTHHHQSPNKIRHGFRITALSERSTTEAIEAAAKGPYAGQFATGVMWHPEYAADPVSVLLLKRFVEEARNYGCSRR